MKNLIERYIELSKQQTEIASQIDKLVRDTAWQYSIADGLVYPHMERPDKQDDLGFWSIDGQGTVTIKWESYWAFGGHAEGAFSFPAHYMYDAAAFEAFKKDCENKKNEREQKEATQELARKQTQFAQLKKELNVP